MDYLQKLNNNNITIIGSGPSLKYLKKKNDIIIFSNSAINYEKLINYKERIWVVGCTLNYYKFNYFINLLLNNLVKPTTIIVITIKNNKLSFYNYSYLKNLVYLIFPNILIMNQDYDLNNIISTGVCSIDIFIKLGFKNLLLCGYDQFEKEYKYYKKCHYMKQNHINHYKDDIKYFLNLNTKLINISIVKDCQLYNFFKKNNLLCYSQC